MNKQKLAYKKLGNVSLFDNEETLDKLNSLGNPLERLSKVIDFEIGLKRVLPLCSWEILRRDFQK